MPFNALVSNLAIFVLQGVSLYGLSRLAAPKLFPKSPRARLLCWNAVLALLWIVPLMNWLLRDNRLPHVQFTVVSSAIANRVHETPLPYAEAIAALLVAGAAFRILRILAGLWQLRRLRLSATVYNEQAYLSPNITVPASYGFRKPVVLLPHNWPGVDPALQMAAWAHELIHIQRSDWLKQIAEEIQMAIFWFHPVLPSLFRRIRLTREQVVDAQTLRVTRAPEDYLRALLAFAAPENNAVPLACFSQAEQLKQRVETIQTQKEPNMSKKKVIRSLLSTAGFLLAGTALTVWSVPLVSSTIQASDDPVYKVGGDIRAPQLISKVEPDYTDEARDAKINGIEVLSFVIDREGKPKSVVVLQGLGHGLNEKAIDAVNQWRFSPATKDGKPVSVQATIEVDFRYK